MNFGNNGTSQDPRHQNSEGNNSNSNKFSRIIKREGEKPNALHQEPEDLKKYGVGQALLDHNILKASKNSNSHINKQSINISSVQINEQEQRKGSYFIQRISIICKTYGESIDDYMINRGIDLEKFVEVGQELQKYLADSKAGKAVSIDDYHKTCKELDTMLQILEKKDEKIDKEKAKL